MSYTNPKGSAAALFIPAQARRDSCQGCNSADKRGAGDGAFLHCTALQRRVSNLSVCAKWAPVLRRQLEVAA